MGWGVDRMRQTGRGTLAWAKAVGYDARGAVRVPPNAKSEWDMF